MYFGFTHGLTLTRPDGKERGWIPKRELKKIDNEERRRADGEDVKFVPYSEDNAPSAEKQQALDEYIAKKADEYNWSQLMVINECPLGLGVRIVPTR